jgi:DNA-binding NtrC family response regulator
MGKISDPVSVLLATDRDDTASRLRGLFDRTRWRLEVVNTCREAISVLRSGVYGVVIAEKELPDGTWRDVLDSGTSMDHAPNLVVTSGNADECLWSEVLSRGGYDVLPRPFDRAEVVRIVSLAWQDWRRPRAGAQTHAAIA